MAGYQIEMSIKAGRLWSRWYTYNEQRLQAVASKIVITAVWLLNKIRILTNWLSSIYQYSYFH